MIRTYAGLTLLAMPCIIWCVALGYLLGFKVVLILTLIIPVLLLSFMCKIAGKILLNS